MSDADLWSEVPPPPTLTGAERFDGLEATVADFWSWAMSDLRMNNVRGYFAEFLVCMAVGAAHARVEWDAVDVIAPNGCRIEVKASAYVQAWAQRRPSRIVFTGLRGQTWTPQDGFSGVATYNADVYVFALQTSASHATYDPLDISQWAFWVMSATRVRELGLASISLARLSQLTNRVGFEGLGDAIANEFLPPASS